MSDQKKTAGEEVVFVERKTALEDIELQEIYYLYEETHWQKLLIAYFPLCYHNDGSYSGMSFSVPLSSNKWEEEIDMSHPRAPFSEVEPFYEFSSTELLHHINGEDSEAKTPIERPPLVYVIRYGSFVNLAKKALKLYEYFPEAIEKLESKLQRTKEVWAGMEAFKARDDEEIVSPPTQE